MTTVLFVQQHVQNNSVENHNWPNWKVNPPGGPLNKKDGLTRYGDSHVKDKTS